MPPLRVLPAVRLRRRPQLNKSGSGQVNSVHSKCNIVIDSSNWGTESADETEVMRFSIKYESHKTTAKNMRKETTGI